MEAGMATDGGYVLVVDDDPDIVDSMRFVLEDAGYSVRSALDGREALELMRREAGAALVILDLAMPVMNGMAFRAEQAKDAALARVPVIVLSGDGHVQEKAAKLGGSVLWLKKPIDLDALIDAVRDHGAWGSPRGEDLGAH
jgi:CheY-like chemotaxis protein